MANEKQSTSPREASASGRGMNPMLVGIVIGLLLGIAIALGVAIWLNRAKNPFMEREKPVEALPSAATAPVTTPPAATAANSQAKADPTKPRFEFYDLLPGDKSGKAANAPAPAAAKPATDTAAKNAAAAKTDEPKKPADIEVPADGYFLQVGAFQREADATNMKAKIALTGLEASNTAVNLADKGTLYRVRLGPFKTLEETNKTKTALSQNGIGSSVVKPENSK